MGVLSHATIPVAQWSSLVQARVQERQKCRLSSHTAKEKTEETENKQTPTCVHAAPIPSPLSWQVPEMCSRILAMLPPQEDPRASQLELLRRCITPGPHAEVAVGVCLLSAFASISIVRAGLHLTHFIRPVFLCMLCVSLQILPLECGEVQISTHRIGSPYFTKHCHEVVDGVHQLTMATLQALLAGTQAKSASTSQSWLSSECSNCIGSVVHVVSTDHSALNLNQP